MTGTPTREVMNWPSGRISMTRLVARRPGGQQVRQRLQGALTLGRFGGVHGRRRVEADRCGRDGEQQ